MERNKALVVFSGGQDSTTCLFWALENFKEVHTITFTYGQRHGIEVEMARKIAEKAGVDFHLTDIAAIASIGRNSLTDSSIEMDQKKPADSFPNTFVPGRNLMFLTVAAMLAYRRSLNVLVGGMCETDFSGYPDCRDDAIKALQVALNIGMDTRLNLVTPLMWKNKKETWQLAFDLGGQSLVDLIVQETHTCYIGTHDELHEWGYGCGQCPACLLRKRGFAQYCAEKQAS